MLVLVLVLVLVLDEAVHAIEGIVKNRDNRFTSRARAPAKATEHVDFAAFRNRAGSFTSFPKMR